MINRVGRKSRMPEPSQPNVDETVMFQRRRGASNVWIFIPAVCIADDVDATRDRRGSRSSCTMVAFWSQELKKQKQPMASHATE